MRIYFIQARQLLAALVLTIMLLLGIINLCLFSKPLSEDVFYAGITMPSVLIDPGHGGLDGGASSPGGLIEAPLNLDISLRLRDLFAFIGIQSVLTREDDRSLGYREELSIRENKRADLNARLACSQSYPEQPFLSIHLNKYVQPEYKGAQVFYSPNHAESLTLASCLQEALRKGLDPSNDRRAKLTPESVYLMQHIAAPAVTIECGFLSNPEETAMLRTPEYRKKIAASICCGYTEYLKERGL